MNAHVCLLLSVACILPLPVYAVDLNPPDYRGDPLSVSVSWEQIPNSLWLQLSDYAVVDDADPLTTLYPFQPQNLIETDVDTFYQFEVLNWMDALTTKFLRLQLTWTHTNQAPMTLIASAVQGSTPITGDIAFTSPVTVVDATLGIYYRYYDIIYSPTPDVERFTVRLADNGQLSHIVVDSVSTAPEPGTVALMGLGALALRLKRHKP